MQPVLTNQMVANSTGAETDTISISIYDATTFALTGTTKGVLMTDGNSVLSFSGPDGNYYIAMSHRNSVLTWSSSAVTLSSATPASYDFSINPLQSFSGDAWDNGDGSYSIFTGDVNQDEFIDASDFPLYDADNLGGLFLDYYATDFSGDGFVDASDFPIYDTNNLNGKFSIHP